MCEEGEKENVVLISTWFVLIKLISKFAYEYPCELEAIRLLLPLPLLPLL